MKDALLLVCAAVAAMACRADVTLVENGAARCRVEVAAEADPAVKFGAREIAKYLGLASGAEVVIEVEGQRIEVEGQRSEVGQRNDLIPIRLSTQQLCNSATLQPSNPLRSDGFLLDVRPDVIAIVGANPRGTLYGCYELVKRAAGVRWLLPGDDGEYVPKRATLTLPEGRQVSNPYLAIRECRGGCRDFYLWSARNGLLATCRRQDYLRDPSLREMAVRPHAGHDGHVLTYLMLGWGEKRQRLANAERLFAEHPEYFPLKKGKRVKIDHALSPNPCVSNPALVEIMASNLWEAVKGHLPDEDYFLVGNNDTTEWCECDACKALDAPEAAGTKGERSDRYWHLLGELGRRVWAKDPSVKLAGWAYQNFWYPPVREKIDPRFKVLISFNNQCWRHPIADTNCVVNTEFRKILSAWKATGHPLVVNRDEIGATGSPGSTYAPAETVFARSVRAYPELGLNGSHLCTNVPENPPFLAYAKDKPPYYGKNYRWYAIWQTVYLAAHVMWNREAPLRSLYEEANILYYGAGWEAGFHDFQRVRTKAFLSTPGCIGWGEGASIAPTTAKANVMSRMRSDLERALAAVEKSGDERAKRHLLRDREIFEATWGVANSNRLARATRFVIFPGGFDKSDTFLFKDVFATGTYTRDALTLRLEGADGTTVGRLPLSLAYSGRPDEKPLALEVDLSKGAAELTVSAAKATRPFLGGATWRLTLRGVTADFNLGEQRPQGIWSQGADSSAWKNGSFSGRNGKNPTGWGGPLSREKAVVEEGGNAFLRLPWKGRFGGVDQSFVASHTGKVSVVFRARGKGRLHVWGAGLKEIDLPLEENWRVSALTAVKKTAKDPVTVHFSRADENSSVDLDDVYVNPEELTRRGGASEELISLPAGNVILTDRPDAPERFAAEAFAQWAKTLTGKPRALVFRRLPEGEETVREEGFRLDAAEGRAVLAAKQSFGFVAGVHYLLSRFGGIRWFTPDSGADLPSGVTELKVPCGTLVRNPLRSRAGLTPSGGKAATAEVRRAIDLWHVRNGFRAVNPAISGERRPIRASYFKESEVKAGAAAGRRYLDEFRAWKAKSCPDKPAVWSLFALDVPSSEAWWKFVNPLAKEALADPLVHVRVAVLRKCQAWPEGMTAEPIRDKRLSVLFYTHGRCHLHALEDPDCPHNAAIRERLLKWKASGLEVNTFEFMNQLDGRCNYAFWERAWVRDLKWYAREDLANSEGGLVGPWAGMPGRNDTYARNNAAKARWLTAYLTGWFSWDAADDFESVRADALRRYYRAAAEPMARYHDLLESAMLASGAHLVYGGAMAFVAASMEPGVLEKGKALLAEAQALARGDAELQRRIARDAEYFRAEWLEAVPAPTAAETHALPSDLKFGDSRLVVRREGANLVVETELARPKDGYRDFPDDGTPFAAMKGTHVEFQLFAPTMKGRYWHFAVSHNGIVYSALTESGQSRDLTRKLDVGVERFETASGWKVTCKIPLAALGENAPSVRLDVFDGVRTLSGHGLHQPLASPSFSL